MHAQRARRDPVLLEERKPTVVFLQETWLNDDCKEINCIPGYVVVGRRDRSIGENRGGVLTLCRRDFFHYMTHVQTSDVAERMWHYVILDSGIYVLCNWLSVQSLLTRIVI